MPNTPDDGRVGYGKPPRQTRFKKGRSGNPAGRPKGALNLATTLERTLKAQVLVTAQGRRRTITKFEAALTQLVNQAASGEGRAMTLLLNIIQVVEHRWEAHPVSVEPLPEADQRVMTRLLGRLHRLTEGGPPHGSEPTRI
jgi:hypothetical protein